MNEMEKNEMVEFEQENVEVPEVVEDTNSGISTGLAMLIGSGLTLAGLAGFKKLKKVWKKRKAKKELDRQQDDVIDAEFDIVSDENENDAD